MAKILSYDSVEKLVEQLKRDEGCKKDSHGNHVVYKCTAGARTIGYGHNLDAKPIDGLGDGAKITEDYAIELLHYDIGECIIGINKKLPWTENLDDVRYCVLVNMAFNLGLHGLLGFKNTLKFIEQGNYAQAAVNMGVSKWASQVKSRADRLIEQMRTGEWQ